MTAITDPADAVNKLDLNTDVEQAKKVLYDAIDSISDELRDISLDLHAHPEIGMEEHHAHKILTDYLEKKGFTIKRHAFGLETAFLAEYSQGEGRRVGFCSEYDALPGLGHACGHNLIAISGLACAVGVKTLLETGYASGKVVLFGTPSEEPLNGKIIMSKKGAFKDNVDVCMMLHPSNSNGNHASMFAQDDFKVEYHGTPAHAGGAPWQGINALDAICQAWVNVGLLRQQLESTDRIHGIITNGGQAPNIIPNFTSGYFYVRAPTAARVKELRVKAENCFKAAALATGCEVVINWREVGICKDVQQNELLADAYGDLMGEFGYTLPPKLLQRMNPVGGSTDFGNVSYDVPGLHPFFDIFTKTYPHTVGFVEHTCKPEAHKGTIVASKALAAVGSRVLIDQNFYDAVCCKYEDRIPVGLRS